MTREGRESVAIAACTESATMRLAVDELASAIRGSVSIHDLGDVSVERVDVVVGVASALDLDVQLPSNVSPEGFRIDRIEGTNGPVTVVVAPAESGAMYGAMELAERVRAGVDVADVEMTTSSPAVSFRAIKFNLPWSPYRGGEQTEVHYDTCRDLDFWEAFLDMMARNRFNALTLWNLHPFPYMIQPENYPEARRFDDDEHEEWKYFWRSLFRMAHDRGIETYVLNWNIVVPPEFAAAYDVDERNDRSEVIKEYTRECVTQLVNEYEQLDGLGVSLCDWMTGMTPREKEEWMLDTIVAGIEDADRSVTFLHRSVLTGSIEAMRRGIDETAKRDNVARVLVPTKFNWSHGHSTTRLELTHDYSSGKVDDQLWNPTPENYSIAWMIRNEDVFVLRWGDPDFVREHIAENRQEYVDGYFVGSEAYIPAKDFSHRTHRHQTWEYAFEKQWLFYVVWGRLLYDPETPDAVFERAFADRYGSIVAADLLEAYRLASTVPEELASFHAGTWDYTLYSEGFLAPVESLGLDEVTSPFISIDEFVDHETLDSRYLSIPEYVSAGTEVTDDETVTPPDLADRMDDIADQVLALTDSIDAELGAAPGALECELRDLEAWAHLSRYFAAKLEAGVALERYRNGGGDDEDREEAISILEGATDHWDAVVAATEDHYREIPYATDWREGETFSWAKYRDQVQRDVEIAKRERRS